MFKLISLSDDIDHSHLKKRVGRNLYEVYVCFYKGLKVANEALDNIGNTLDGIEEEIQNLPYTSAEAGDTFIWNDLEYGVVEGANGRLWLDRNLGATRVATSPTDSEAYGDLYQWGRLTDGHEKRTSGTTSVLSTSDVPGHGDFITNSVSPYDWRNPQNDNLWQGVEGINNPCPPGWRLPTAEEWDTERLSWSTNNGEGAYNSPLKLPFGGYRFYYNGSIWDTGYSGNYWTSTVDGILVKYLSFTGGPVEIYSGFRTSGYSIRPIKDY